MKDNPDLEQLIQQLPLPGQRLCRAYAVERGLTNDPTEIEWLAQAYLDCGNTGSAIALWTKKDIQKAIALCEKLHFYHRAAELSKQKGDYITAAKLYEKAAYSDISEYAQQIVYADNARYCLSDAVKCAIKAGELGLALEYCQQWPLRNAHSLRIKVHQLRGEENEAKEVYRKAKISLTFQKEWSHLSLVAEDYGNLDDALKYAHKDGDWDRVAELYEQKGELSQAVIFYQKSGGGCYPSDTRAEECLEKYLKEPNDKKVLQQIFEGRLKEAERRSDYHRALICAEESGNTPKRDFYENLIKALGNIDGYVWREIERDLEAKK